MLSADKNHSTENVSDHAQNNFRGYRKCSGTFWNFSEKSFAENILSQREGTRSHESGVACLVAFCLGSMHVSWRHVGGLLGGPPPWGDKVLGCHGSVPLVPPLCYLFTLPCWTCSMGSLVFPPPPHPLPWPINRGGGAALHTHPLLTYMPLQ